MTKLEDERRRQYGERNRLLLAMGFRSYRDYLASDLWSSIRARVLYDGVLCAGGCRRRATQVHHGRYTRPVMEGRDLRHLYPVCGGCHFAIEFRNGVKLSPHRATKRLKGRSRRRGSKHRRLGAMKKSERQDVGAVVQSVNDDKRLAAEALADLKRRQALFPTKPKRSERRR